MIGTSDYEGREVTIIRAYATGGGATEGVIKHGRERKKFITTQDVDKGEDYVIQYVLRDSKPPREDILWIGSFTRC